MLPENSRTRRRLGFTLIELLVVVSIIAILVGLLIPSLSRARMHARMVSELAGAKQLGMAYFYYSDDRRGELLPGYVHGVPGTDETGATLTGEPAIRYPWRVAEYIDHGVEGSILVNGRKQEIEQDIADETDPATRKSMWQYNVSLQPSFGLNLYQVGGDRVTPSNNAPGMITRQNQAAAPAMLIAFGSARMNGSVVGQYIPGFFRITAPEGPPFNWSATYNPAGSADWWGYVDVRYGENAVFGMLDGHAEPLNLDQMSEQIRWSNAAAKGGG